MPSSAERVCFTLWMSDKWGSRAASNSLSTSALLEDARHESDVHGGNLPEHVAKQLLQNPKIQLLVAKLQYANEWAESIKESHADTAGRAEALSQFWADQDIIRAAVNFLQSYLPPQPSSQRKEHIPLL